MRAPKHPFLIFEPALPDEFILADAVVNLAGNQVGDALSHLNDDHAQNDGHNHDVILVTLISVADGNVANAAGFKSENGSEVLHVMMQEGKVLFYIEPHSTETFDNVGQGQE